MDKVNAQMAIHAVSCQVVNGDAVLYQKLFVVQIMFIVARMVTRVDLELARWDLM